MSLKKIVIGVLAGAVTGTVLGVLYAPDKGRSTRRRIIDKGQSYVSQFEKMMDGYLSEFNEKMENLKVEFTALSHNGKADLQDSIKESINTKIK